MSTIRFQQVNVPAGVIDLGVGQPQNALLPHEHFRRAAERQFAGAGSEHLQYGAEWGDGHLRLALAAYLTGAYGCPVDPAHLFVTNGNSQALDQICTMLAAPGDVVVVEEPTYFHALTILRDHGLEVIGVPVDGDGLDVDALAVALDAQTGRGRRVAFVYTIPTYQNPTGTTMTTARRDLLVDVCRERGVLVVADEVYHLLAYGDPPPPPLSAYVGRGPVVSLGTFSKILAPGVRLGWAHGAPDLLGRLAGSGLVDSGGGLNPIPGALVTTILEEGWQAEILDGLRSTYSSRVATMATALRTHLPAEVGYEVPEGGYFFWLTLPDGVSAEELRARAVVHGVDGRHGALFSCRGGLADRLRLSFAYYDEADIEDGIARLGRAFAQM